MFHINLKKLREKSGLSQKQIAEQLNISPQSVSKWEKGAALPSINYLPKLAECLNCDINTFFYPHENLKLDVENLFIFIPLIIKNRETKRENKQDVIEYIKKYPHIANDAISLLQVIKSHTIISSKILQQLLDFSVYYADVILYQLSKHNILGEQGLKNTYSVDLQPINELITILENYNALYLSIDKTTEKISK